MATDFILDSLVIKLKGDDTGYRDTLKDAQAHTAKAADTLKSVLGTTINQISINVAQANVHMQGAGKAGVASFTLIGTTAAAASVSIISLTTSAQSLFRTFISGVQNIEKTDLQARRLGLTFNELKTANIWGGAAGQASIT